MDTKDFNPKFGVKGGHFCAEQALPVNYSAHSGFEAWPGVSQLSADHSFFQWPFQEPFDWRYLPYLRPIF